MSELPTGWESAIFGEVVRIVSGGTPPSKDETNFAAKGGIPWLTPADLSGYRETYISGGARNLSEKGYAACSATKIPAGSVLFSSRAPIGYVAIASNEISTNQGFKSFVLPDGMNSHFLYYYLKHIKPVAEQMATGTTFKELSGTATAKLPLLVAPLPEQKRIADKLDSVLARVDACRDRLDRLPALLKRFRQSILAAATSGRLTEDLRSSRCFASWDETNCSAVSSFQNGYAFKSETFESNGEFQIVKLANVKDGVIKLDAAPAFLAAKNAEEFLRFQPSSGDLLISMTGTRYKRDYGFVCEVPPNLSLLINQRVGRFIPDASKILGKFLAITLRSEQFRSQFFEGETGGVNQGNVGSEHIKSCNLMLPSFQEQTEIVRRVEILFAFADRLEARLSSARRQVGQLTPALLAKAFRGELVPQDPADEPATELLKRLAAQREAAPKAKRTRAKS